MKKLFLLFTTLLLAGAGCQNGIILGPSGTITGNLGFPSDGPLPKMKVCAEDTTSKKSYCTEKVSEQKDETAQITRHTYALEVPPGKYLVYSQVPEHGTFKDYKAYYTQFVVCGIKAGCNDHAPVEVEVKENETKEKIDPMDWYK